MSFAKNQQEDQLPVSTSTWDICEDSIFPPSTARFRPGSPRVPYSGFDVTEGQSGKCSGEGMESMKRGHILTDLGLERFLKADHLPPVVFRRLKPVQINGRDLAGRCVLPISFV